MGQHGLVWDLVTVPDLAAVPRVNGLDEGDKAAAQEVLGDRFPKHYYHQIACIGALVAERVDGVWQVRSVGLPIVASVRKLNSSRPSWTRSQPSGRS